MRVGILGGSFNPPHNGHLALARRVLELGLAERVMLVPAAVPPHKVTPREDSATRLAMTELLAAEDARLEVNDIELERPGPSYTVDTVRQLVAERQADVFHLIIGSDMASTFATWREFRELLRLAAPLSAERPDSVFAADLRQRYPGMTSEEMSVMERGRFIMTPVPISSTLIRTRIAAGASDAELLTLMPASVLRFVRERGLYQ